MKQQTVVVNDKNNNLLVRGLIIGGVIGGALSLLDSQTRKKVKTTAVDFKDSSVDMFSQVKENPGEVKEQMMQRFKAASNSLKEAISEAQDLYEMVNKEVFGKVSNVKSITNETLYAAKEATEEIKEISSKVAEAGQKLTGSIPVPTGTKSLESGTDTTYGTTSTGYNSGALNSPGAAGTGTGRFN
ncbi:gas vesicle protein [Peribacillus deserti]|uniref:Gas vesicle protein n=1 Tax=Peribacillus deserti TaxID=673318 RepID=A0ABS2QDR9_9BACI|nr:YtxH domain-containing protein [Peribacillus deserti]MBM7691170.1 gas vesicle protein [Peribacillus deserti]